MTQLSRKARPTNADLQEQSFELHGCLENVANVQAHQAVQIAAICKALGIEVPSAEEIAAGAAIPAPKRRVAGMRRSELIAWAVPIVGLGVTLYKVIEPAIVAGALALHHALMAAH